MKRISKSYGGNVYGQKKLIKTLINVLPIVIVPLVTERKRIKEHPDVQKVTNATSKATSKTTSAISNKASDVKEVRRR